MSELRTKINQRDEEIRVVNQLVSRSSMTDFSHPRVARLQKDNEEDAATLLNLLSQATEGLNPIRNLAQSSAVTKGIYQSRADLLALVEKLEADMRSLTQQQAASLSKPSESPTTTTSKKRKQPESSAVSSSSPVVTPKVLQRLERNLNTVREEVVDAQEAVAQWGDHFSDDMESRFNELIAEKNKFKSIQAAQKRSATEEKQLEYEKQRAEDRDKIAQFMAEAVVLDEDHQQLKKVHKDNTDRIARVRIFSLMMWYYGTEPDYPEARERIPGASPRTPRLPSIAKPIGCVRTCSTESSPRTFRRNDKIHVRYRPLRSGAQAQGGHYPG
jgi:hypothetical protein